MGFFYGRPPCYRRGAAIEIRKKLGWWARPTLSALYGSIDGPHQLSGLSPGWLESIELTLTNPAQERIPLSRGKTQNRPFVIFTITNHDKIARQASHLDTVSICMA